MPTEANTASKGGGELRVPVPDQVSEPVTALLELNGEVAGEPGGPLPRGVCRDPWQMHPPGPYLEDERDMQTPERAHAAGMQEVRSQQPGGMGAQEGGPGLVAARRRRDPVSPQDLADGAGGYPVPEPAKLALDPDHCPAPDLPGQPHDQGDQLTRERRPARRPGLPPPRRGQAAAPAQQRTRGHYPARPQRPRQNPGERAKHRPVTPRQPRPGIRPAQHRDLVPQHEYLRILR
jgi:hypothetical protein